MDECLPVNVNIESTSLQQVTKFEYLGSLMSEDESCASEIRAMVEMEKANFGMMRNILTNLRLSVKLKQRLVKSYILSGMLNGCENWTTSATNQKILEATDMWFLMRMMRVPWTVRNPC